MAGNYPTVRTAENRRRVLAALETGSSLTRAAEAAGLARDTLWRWREDDAEFAAECANAIEAGTDRLEDEAVRRAVEGGSDTMLIFMLKARRRAKYGDHQRIEHSGEVLTKEQRDAGLAAAVQALR